MWLNDIVFVCVLNAAGMETVTQKLSFFLLLFSSVAHTLVLFSLCILLSPSINTERLPAISASGQVCVLRFMRDSVCLYSVFVGLYGTMLKAKRHTKINTRAYSYTEPSCSPSAVLLVYFK